MDIISLGDEQRALTSLQLLTSTSQTLMLDLENCSLQSGLWRSIFQGHIRLSLELISVGVGQSSSARVEQATRHVSPARINTRHTCIKTTVPSLLSPLLSDSPCTNNLHVRLPRKRTGQPAALEFSILATNHVTRHVISPLVDRGHVQTEHVSSLVSSLITSQVKYFCVSNIFGIINNYFQTDHSCAGDSSVVDTTSMVPLMFGQLAAGLRQLAVRYEMFFVSQIFSEILAIIFRAILEQILFNCSPEQAGKKLDNACQKQGFILTQLLVNPSSTNIKEANDPRMMSYEYEIELGSEMELSFRNVNITDDNIDDSVELAVSDVVVSDIVPTSESNDAASNNDDDDDINDYAQQTVSELMDTIANIDRELEVIKTDCELDR